MKWQESDKRNWFSRQKIQRSYLEEVVTKVKNLNSNFDIEQYAELSQNPKLYPLFIIKSKNPDPDKKNVLITGGVHGYETSGIHGAIAFLERIKLSYIENFNIVCVPCISPWSYEVIHRWNPQTIDPNRWFIKSSPSEECRLFLKAMDTHNVKPYVHFDLHETTDTDNTIFRPELAERDGIEHEFSEIPDGFYVVGNTENSQIEFLKAIIESVKQITHIAPPDENGKIIGEPIEQEGIINYPLRKLNLCAGFSDAKYTATTEVYPDSPKVTSAICVDVQVAAIEGGLNLLLNNNLF